MKTDKTLPENSMRDDLRYRPEAIARGWKVKTPEISGNPLSFEKGEKVLWRIRDGWRCADLTGNGSSVSVRYRNHRTHSDLVTALQKE